MSFKTTIVHAGLQGIVGGFAAGSALAGFIQWLVNRFASGNKGENAWLAWFE